MRLIGVILALLLVSGCAQNTAGISISSKNQNVVLSNEQLAKKLELGSAKTQVVNNRLQASVTIANKTTKTQELLYRFYWYDELGLELNDNESPWQQLILYGGDEKAIQGVAINPAAANFRVSIRDAK